MSTWWLGLPALALFVGLLVFGMEYSPPEPPEYTFEQMVRDCSLSPYVPRQVEATLVSGRPTVSWRGGGIRANYYDVYRRSVESAIWEEVGTAPGADDPERRHALTDRAPPPPGTYVYGVKSYFCEHVSKIAEAPPLELR